MKRKTLYMLLFSILLTVTVGLANTNVNEQNHYSDGVGLVDVVVMDIENQVTFDTVFDFQRIDNYTLVSVSPILSINVVKDLQKSNVAITSNKLRPELVNGVVRIQLKAARKSPIKAKYIQSRGAITQLLFYNQIGKLDV